MSGSSDSVTNKVIAIFAEMVSDRSRRLDPGVLSNEAWSRVTAALTGNHGLEQAGAIAHHMVDWNWDAAFIVALHLFPERFSDEEIREGLGAFLTHAPNHIREACRLTGYYVWESFPDD